MRKSTKRTTEDKWHKSNALAPSLHPNVWQVGEAKEVIRDALFQSLTPFGSNILEQILLEFSSLDVRECQASEATQSPTE